PEYPVLFTEAYGSADITEERIARALAQFVRSMISYQTKFDEGVDTNWQNLTTDETEGAFLFSGMCAKCHQGTLQSSKGAANNGLDVESVFDLGIGGDTELAEDVGKFKIPSLRNVAVTAPYMHDGRFATLEQVIRHYLTGVQAHENLDARLQVNGSPQYLPLSQKQIEQLMAFLNTLTDHALLTDEKFSNPFVNSF
ncbi:MAG: c-type cytochrome, partial [Reinekea sp.]|nr:c-type cytochrome [Reinekea sp.]